MERVKKQEKLGQIEKEKAEIISNAKKEAEILMGEGDQEAARIYNDAYSQNTEFYKFWRALSSYKKTLPKTDKILTTDLDYFRFLEKMN